jgi:hypothetical protein
MSTAVPGIPDLQRLDPGLWEAVPGDPSLVDVPPLTYLAFDGAGAPCDPPFGMAIGSIAAAAAGLPPMPIEVWFWTDPPETFDANRQDLWQWTVGVAVPGTMAVNLLAAAQAGDVGPAADRMRVLQLTKGPSMQVLHVGPYDALGRSVGALHSAMAASGLTFAGPHHEIYLDDPGRISPDALRTIMRQPVRPAAS